MDDLVFLESLLSDSSRAEMYSVVSSNGLLFVALGSVGSLAYLTILVGLL